MVVDLFLVYQFVRRLATPFNKWDAYESGVIDDKGNVLIKKKDRTREQKKTFGIYDVMIRNLKRLLAKVPGGDSKLASYAAALFLIKEYKAFTPESTLTEDMDEDTLNESMDLFSSRYLHYIQLSEDVNQKIHPDVIKAYKKSLDAEDRDGEYGTVATRRAATRAANTLSKKIKQHYPDLDMNGKIKLRTQLQNMGEEADLDELSLSLKDLKKSGINKKGYGNKDKLKKELERLKKGLAKESLEEAMAKPPRWKKAGPDGEIEIVFPTGRKFRIEKQYDENIRHRGEFKVLEWDKRTKEWEWADTYSPKSYAKEIVMRLGQFDDKGKQVVDYSASFQYESKMEEDAPTVNVGSGNIAGVGIGPDGEPGFTPSQMKKHKKRAKKSFKDLMARKVY